jgi:peroxiredoxin Q/BCP
MTFALRPATLGTGVLLAIAMVACGGPVRRPDGGTGLLPPGSVAPDVVGYDADQREVRVSALRGRPVVVYFYPKDESPVCTREACAFRDAWTRYVAAGVSVIGVSGDSARSHDDFLKNEKLPFALASDGSGGIASSYGVARRFWGDDRITFLVGRDGKIAHVWPNVDPGTHASDVLDVARTLP